MAHQVVLPDKAFASGQSEKRSALNAKMWQQKPLFLFMLPGALAVLVFSYAPMMGLVMAFRNYRVRDGFFGSAFVGLQHFEKFLQAPDFNAALGNTLAISTLSLVIGFPLPIILALLVVLAVGQLPPPSAAQDGELVYSFLDTVHATTPYGYNNPNDVVTPVVQDIFNIRVEEVRLTACVRHSTMQG